MKYIIGAFYAIVISLLMVKCVFADDWSLITPSGAYLINQTETTTFINKFGTIEGATEIAPAITVPRGSTSGHTIISPTGSYWVSPQGDIIIQTGKVK